MKKVKPSHLGQLDGNWGFLSSKKLFSSQGPGLGSPGNAEAVLCPSWGQTSSHTDCNSASEAIKKAEQINIVNHFPLWAEGVRAE